MEKSYYYQKDGSQVGPVTIEQMRGMVTPDTYIWADGMANWTQVSQLPDIMAQLGMNTFQQPVQSAQPSYQNTYNTNAGGAMPPKPNNHLVMSIISIFFCQLLGIIAIVMSIMCDSAYKSGDYEEAVKKAKIAKVLSLISIISMGIFWVIYLGMIIFAASTGALQTY